MRLLVKLQQLKNLLPALTRWRRRGALFVLGMCLAAAMPPVYLLPLMVAAFIGLMWTLQGAADARRRFWDGWWFGWGFYIAGNYWIAISLLTDAEKFGWLIPFTVFGLTGVLAIFPALACALAGQMRGQVGDALRLAAAWALLDWLRGHVLTGFPWNLPATALAFSDALIQPMAILGAYGVSFLLVLACLLPATWRKGQRSGLMATAALWGLLILGAGAGAWRLYQADQRDEAQRYVSGVKLRLVQANVSQHHKWNAAQQMRGLQEHIQLSLLSEGLDDVTHLIWPETAVPYVLSGNTRLLGLLSTVAPQNGALITGALRSEGEEADWKIWNSLVVIGREGTILSSYDKHHLVPFGEFVPLRALLPIDKITAGATDFSAGPGPMTVKAPGAPDFSPLICYEAIFPGEVVSREGSPQWLLNITNDAWFGRSSGPYQHLVSSRLRAVEQGLPLVRAANTGISAVVDAYGRVIKKLPLGEKAILDSPLPVSAETTLYSRFGDVAAVLLMAAAYVAGLTRKRTKA